MSPATLASSPKRQLSGESQFADPGTSSFPSPTDSLATTKVNDDSSVIIRSYKPDPLARLKAVVSTQSSTPLESSRYEVSKLDGWEARVLQEIRYNFAPEKKSAYLDSVFQLCSAVRDLLELPEVQALNDRRQMSASYTGRCARANHTRLLHSSDVMERAVDIALRLECKTDEVVLVGLAAFLHDVGHGPFSHSGESVLREMGDIIGYNLGLNGAFHHEPHSWKLIAGDPDSQDDCGWGAATPIAAVLDDNNILAKEVVSVLKGDDPKFRVLSAILDEADRNTYLLRDYYGSFSKKDEKLAHMCARVVTNSEEGFLVEDGQLYVRDHRGYRAVMTLRMMLYAEASMHESALLADAVIREELRELFAQGFVSPEDFVRLTDSQALRLFSERAQNWLTPGEKTIEDHFEIVGQWKVSDLNDLGRVSVNTPSFTEDLQAMLSSHLGDERVYIPRLENTRKEIVVHEKSRDGKVRRIPYAFEIPNDKRHVFVAVPKDAGLDTQLLETLVSEYMQRYLKKGAVQAQGDILRSKVRSIRDYSRSTVVSQTA